MAEQTQPNILVLMTDQQRYDSLGCYGFAAAHTPNLDRLAADGALFEHCYVNNPLCTPSRASMMTGKHLPGHGVYRLYDNLPQDEVLFPDRLRQMGYETALFGKLHVSSLPFEDQNRNAHDGFDIYEWCLEHCINLDSPYNGYAAWLKEKDPALLERLRVEVRKVEHLPQAVHMTHWAAERSIDYLERRRAPDKPFFCMMSVFDPHNPYENWPLEMGDLVDETKIPDPLVIEGELDRTPRVLRRIHEETVGRPGPEASLAELRRARYGYHVSIALFDLEVGRVLAALDKAGLAENTLVIYVSDHGDLLGDHEQYVKGAALYDPCVHVPFIMRWPARYAGGRRLSQLVQPHDIAATVLAAAGAPDALRRQTMPDALDLTPLCAGEGEQGHDCVYTLHRNSGLVKTRVRTFYYDPPVHATMIRDQRYKLVTYHAAAPGQVHEGQLFDMVSDPSETHNLWDHPAYAQVRLQMTEHLMDWLVQQEIRHLGSRGGESQPLWWAGTVKDWN
jgi:arylsulfatase A-like enzyme